MNYLNETFLPIRDRLKKIYACLTFMLISFTMHAQVVDTVKIVDNRIHFKIGTCQFYSEESKLIFKEYLDKIEFSPHGISIYYKEFVSVNSSQHIVSCRLDTITSYVQENYDVRVISTNPIIEVVDNNKMREVIDGGYTRTIFIVNRL